MQKFKLIEQLSNIHKIDKEILKFRLKRREDFWIQKLETLTPTGLELNDVKNEIKFNSCQLHFFFDVLHFRLQFGNETLLSNRLTKKNWRRFPKFHWKRSKDRHFKTSWESWLFANFHPRTLLLTHDNVFHKSSKTLLKKYSICNCQTHLHNSRK